MFRRSPGKSIARVLPPERIRPNVDPMVLAVFKMDDHAIELNAASLDLKENLSEASARVHTDSVMVCPTVDVSLSQVLPASPAVAIASPVTITIPLGVCNNAETEYQKQRTNDANRSL
jgi:hypothetical protein